LSVLLLAAAGYGFGQEPMYAISESRLSSIEGLIERQRTELTNLQQTLNAQRTQLSDLEENLQTAGQRLDASEESLTESLKASATLRRQIYQLRMRRDELSNSIARLETRFEQYESAAQSEIRRWQWITVGAAVGGLLLGGAVGIIAQ
jgi:predicted  nucleic acid-binding Zn-ribbon protein